MATEIHELAVEITPRGVEAAKQGLDDVNQKFQQTTEIAREQASVLDDLMDKVRGSMQVVMAGLGVAAAGLASFVPILGSLASGLVSVIQAIGMQVDSVLRPALQPITGLLFDISSAILNAKGPLGTLIGVLGTLVLALGGIAGAAAAAVAAVPLLTSAISGLLTVLSFGSTIIGLIAGVLSGPLIIALLAVAGAIALLWKAWQTNFLNIQGITKKAVKFLTKLLGKFWNILEDIWKNGATALLKHLWNLFNQMRAIMQKISAVFRTGFEIMFDLILSAAKRFGNALVNRIESAVNTAISAVPDVIKSKLGLSPVDLQEPFSPRSASAILRGGAQRLDRRFERIERQEKRGREMNPFAGDNTLTVRIRPKELEQMVSADIDQRTANHGE